MCTVNDDNNNDDDDDDDDDVDDNSNNYNNVSIYYRAILTSIQRGINDELGRRKPLELRVAGKKTHLNWTQVTLKRKQK